MPKKKSRQPNGVDRDLIETCHSKAIDLLKANDGPHGMLAAAPHRRARARGYTAVFGRDAAICAIGMALSGDMQLLRRASRGLRTLARHQAPNGQLPKFVDADGQESDFWYLGCIDATLWWLIAIEFLDRAAGTSLRSEFRKEVARAIAWLSCQEHQRFHLVMQGEASDWADIMPRSGFVLYTNALWYRVKQLYRLPHRAQTWASFNQLFHPFSAGLAEYRRARLLNDYVKRRARNRDLYLSFVNFSFWGEEGDVFGNLLALLFGLADTAAAHHVLRALLAARVNEPYPVRVVCQPIRQNDPLWRDYMHRHRQNLAWQYHNGGIWPFVGGFWVSALAQWMPALAERELEKLARANALGNWQFTEWLHGKTLQARGMPEQSWNAAAFLLAHGAVHRIGASNR
ncbi:MAG TPA: glycoside hydrolase 100 family protein [Burkholderiales bacterium]|nr:glycoside hydrolase 100 family protein [Burkholderiales bacterium]